MRAVAAAAGVSERTIYRYFENRDALYEAARPLFSGTAGIPLCATVEELPAYARELFLTFNRNARLVTTLLTSAWAQELLRRSRASNLAALRALIDAGFARAPVAERSAAAASLRVVLSGSSWLYLRDCGLAPDQSIAHTQWLTRTLLERLSKMARRRTA